MSRLPASARGAVNLIVVVVLLTIIGVGLTLGSRMVASSVGDSTAEDSSVAALYLAESGMEAAVANLGASNACTPAGVGVAGAVNFGRGTYTIQSATAAAPLCQIVVVGAIGNVRRTIQAGVAFGGGTIAFDANTSFADFANTFTWTHTTTGANPVLIVTMALRTNAATSPVARVTYNGVGLTPSRQSVHTTAAAALRSEVWTLTNPAVGANAVLVELTNATTLRGVFHAVSLTGAAQPNAIDTTAGSSACVNNRSDTPAGVILITSQNGSWILDSLAMMPGATATPSLPGQVGWTARTGGGGGHIRGGASYRPIPTAGLTGLGWTLSAAAGEWVDCGITVRPGGATRIVTWAEI